VILGATNKIHRGTYDAPSPPFLDYCNSKAIANPLFHHLLLLVDFVKKSYKKINFF